MNHGLVRKNANRLCTSPPLNAKSSTMEQREAFSREFETDHRNVSKQIC